MKKFICKHCFREVIPGSGCIPPADEYTDFYSRCETCLNRQNDEETILFDDSDPYQSLKLVSFLSTVDQIENPPILRFKKSESDAKALYIYVLSFIVIGFLSGMFFVSSDKAILFCILMAFVFLFCLIGYICSCRYAEYLRFYPDHLETYSGIRKHHFCWHSFKRHASAFPEIVVNPNNVGFFYIKITDITDSETVLTGLRQDEAKFIKTYLSFYFNSGTSENDQPKALPDNEGLEVNTQNSNRFIEFE